MTRQEQILQLIIEGKNIDEILKSLKISKEQLNKDIWELKRLGHNIEREIYYNGTQKFALQKKTPRNITHILDVPENGIFRVLASSDYHIGSTKENIKYIKQMYTFAVQNDIHIILNAGDLIEGIMNNTKHQSYFEHIEYLLETMPQQENLLTLISLGNHDESLVKNTGLDLHTLLNQNRDDIISLGYGVNKIGIGNEEVLISHIAKKICGMSAKLKITGHGHRYNFDVTYGNPTLYLPTLSTDIKEGFAPGFVDMQITMKDGYFSKSTFLFYSIKQNLLTKAALGTYDYETSCNSQKEKKLILEIKAKEKLIIN